MIRPTLYNVIFPILALSVSAQYNNQYSGQQQGYRVNNGNGNGLYHPGQISGNQPYSLTQNSHLNGNQINPINRFDQSNLGQQQNYQNYNNNNQNGRSVAQAKLSFANTPILTSTTNYGALMEVRLISYNNPSLSLPNGKTCTCPPGKTCGFISPGRSSCSFSFLIIISAPDQSVHYIASEFVPTATGILDSGSGNWTQTHILNVTSKPMAIDVFVHQLGIVIDTNTGQLENFDTFVHVDTFVEPLSDYIATPKGKQPNVVTKRLTGQLLGTMLQLSFNVQCINEMEGPSCDLKCKQSAYDHSVALCNSTVGGARKACKYIGNQMTNCITCYDGFNTNQTGCKTTEQLPFVNEGVSPAFRVWTIVLGCLLGIALIFLLLLIILMTWQLKKKQTNHSAQPRYINDSYVNRSAQPLIQREDEWNRGETRVTSVTPIRYNTEQDRVSDGSFGRSNGITSQRREAQV